MSLNSYAHHSDPVKAKRSRKKEKIKLSFADEDPSDSPPMKRFAKNPSVDTSFLPDRQREQRERSEREDLRKEWLAQQERLKAEVVEITYSYWDGSGHRKSVEVGCYVDFAHGSVKRGTILPHS
jgi:protein FAM50